MVDEGKFHQHRGWPQPVAKPHGPLHGCWALSPDVPWGCKMPCSSSEINRGRGESASPRTTRQEAGEGVEVESDGQGEGGTKNTMSRFYFSNPETAVTFLRLT